MVKKIIQLFFFLGLGIFFIWFSFYDIHGNKRLTAEDIETVKNSISGILNAKSLLFIFISILCGVMAHYFRALRNILLIDPLGYRVRKTTVFYSIMMMYLANLAIPRLGEVMRCTFIQRYDKVPFQKTFGTVIAERSLDFIIFILLFVLIICLNTGLLSDLIVNKQKGITLGMRIEELWTAIWASKIIILICALIVVIVTVLIVKINKRKITPTNTSKFIGIFKRLITGLWQGLISVKDLKHPYFFIIHTIAIWICYFLGTYFCFFAFDFLRGLGPFPAFVVLVVGSIGFMAAQGGLGAYPLIVAGILVLYGVDYAQGLAAGWIGWTAQTIMILVVGFAVLILSSFLKIENRKVISDE